MDTALDPVGISSGGGALPPETVQRQTDFRNATIGKHGEKGDLTNGKTEEVQAPVTDAESRPTEAFDERLASIEQSARNLLTQIQAFRNTSL